MTLAEWERLFAAADRYGFTIVSDECYGEIYFDESAPPLGALAAAHRLGRKGFEKVVVMGSLSKRSNAPGLRSGFAAGDAGVLKDFLLYRTYHGSAMSNTVQLASIAAWNDEAHVAREPAPVPREVRRVLRPREPGAAARAPRGRLLLLGRRARRRRGLRARPVRGRERHGAAGQLPLARGARRQSRPRARAHRARLHGRGGRRGRPAHRRIRPRAARGATPQR